MDESYEKYLRTRLGDLQTEAASVQRALDMYLDFKARAARGHTGPTGSNGQATEFSAKPSAESKINKTAFVMDYLKEAGDNGAMQDAVWEEIQRVGVEMSKDHLRSILWHGVKDGRIEKTDDGIYVYVKKEPVA